MQLCAFVWLMCRGFTLAYKTQAADSLKQIALCRFHPPEQFAPFTLSQGLYYNNALENAASAMEIAAIEGKNSALLVEEFLTSIVQQTRGKRCKNAELR